MKRGLVLAAAALGSFVLMSAYLHKQRQSTPGGRDLQPVSAPAREENADDAYARERQQLEDFAGSVNPVEPITLQQKQFILEAKLRHKKAYETVLRDSGIERDTLSAAERVSAHRIAERALRDYRRNFLLDVKPLLSDEQYVLLRNYESTEFKQELERLRATLDDR